MFDRSKHLQNISKIVQPCECLICKQTFGWYTPDFEFEEYFVEIKSTYTIKTCLKSNQIQKIKWVSKNIKTVKIKILDYKVVEKFFIKPKLKQLFN